MVLNDLCWNEIVERVESIYVLNVVNIDVVGKCLKVLISFMERKIVIYLLFGSDICLCFVRVRFFLVFKKLDNFLLYWKGDEFEENFLFFLSDMCMEEKKYFVCCIELLIGNIFFINVEELFKFYLRIFIVEYVMK